MKIKSTVAISDNGFLFDPTTGDSYTTNPVAREIIFLMKENLQADQIKSAILEKYEVDELTLEKNLIDFYSMLHHFNLTDAN
ncbi:MAG TPA: PqqD family protein [Prolixibacteraceae bacterium]|nr:PqqD family protein [Prolixibacteraceae bacterium]